MLVFLKIQRNRVHAVTQQLNEKEEALRMLEKEVADRGYWARTFAVAPELDEFRSEPRFKALIKRLNLPE